MLGNYFRIIPYNNSGTASGGAGTVLVKRKGWYIDSTGKVIWESSAATMFSNGAAISSGNTGATGDATPFDNAGATNPLIGGSFEITYTGTGSPTGAVSFFLQRSVDGGTTWPDTPASAQPRGECIGQLLPSGTTLTRDVVLYE